MLVTVRSAGIAGKTGERNKTKEGYSEGYRL